ncbi:hypothetical protein ZIOFF_057151 [Zingiber officinale]|uniref:PAS domain-containing protein n=1 Tax=Zingiber officinale TaxID=94328 RepID=A0A8J5F2B7_ZINOF|nr:hypothetical protein ZIOFF_057151 [Zingiber officinale]
MVAPGVLIRGPLEVSRGGTGWSYAIALDGDGWDIKASGERRAGERPVGGSLVVLSAVNDMPEFLMQVFGVQLNKQVELEAQAKERHIDILQTQPLLVIRFSMMHQLVSSPNHQIDQVGWCHGDKHEPVDKDDEDRRMHSLTSFKALEVVKKRSLPWEDIEMDAIHSLQLILRGSLPGETGGDNSKNVVSATTDDAKKIMWVDGLPTVTNEMVRLIETASVTIWAIAAFANINSWNSYAADLTIGMPLIDLVEDVLIDMVASLLNHQNQIAFTFDVCDILLLQLQDDIVGVCLVAQDVTGKKMLMDKYTRIQGDYVAIMRNPSELIPRIFIVNESGCCCEWNSAMENLSGIKKEDAIASMVLVAESRTMIHYMELNSVEFNLGDAVDSVVSQGMILSRDCQLAVVKDWPAEAEGSIILKVIPRKERISTGVHVVHLEFSSICRIIHPAPGIPEALLQEMFHRSQDVSRKGLGFFISQKLVQIMNGNVQYLREAERSSFMIFIEFPLVHQHHRGRRKYQLTYESILNMTDYIGLLAIQDYLWQQISVFWDLSIY